MDLNGIANTAAEVVNTNVAVTVQASTGYTIGAGLKQVPSYAAAVSGFGQVQELSSSELRQTEGLNIQGVMRKVYLRSPLNAVIRPDGNGGDLITIANQVWLTVKTLELWPTWCSALVVLQEQS